MLRRIAHAALPSDEAGADPVAYNVTIASDGTVVIHMESSDTMTAKRPIQQFTVE